MSHRGSARGLTALAALASILRTPFALAVALGALLLPLGPASDAATLPAPTAVVSTPPPTLQGAVSRKAHGSAGTFDLPLSLVPSSPAVEPRQGPLAMVVLTFDKPITGATAAVTEGEATAGGPTFSGNDLIVPLSGVTNAQWVTLTLTDVASADGGTGGSGAVRIGFLLGDVNQSRVITVADLGLVNGQIAQPVTSANYLKDVNTSGTLTVADKGITNTQITKALGAIGNQAPTVSAGSAQTVTLPAMATLTGTASDDGLPSPPGAITVAWTKASGPGTVTFDNPSSVATTASFSAPGTYLLRLTAGDGSLISSAIVQVNVDTAVLPPDPGTVAPPIDPTVATTTYAATQFLYTGPNPIQTGVAPGTIEQRRVAVIRGKVLHSSGAPLPGVRVSVLNHPEFGQTLSRSDGMFDLAVNGGTTLNVRYERAGFMPIQRQVAAPWQDYVIAPDAIMMGYDGVVTPINLAAAQTIQVATGSTVTDADGTRRATILFPAGTTATMVFPDGTTQPLTSLNVRATEYTVGPNGPKQMPAPLPPSSGYTYAVELSVDEAIAAGASSVTFSQPLPFYVENFLNFPVGMAVPVGYFDRQQGVWVPAKNGRVIKILSISSGVAVLAVNTAGTAATADELAALSITPAELQQLATLYAAGQSLWRVHVTHFTPWDCNWPYGPPTGARAPGQKIPTSGGNSQDNCDRGCGSVIEIQNQVLGETTPIVGTPFTLNYRSDRVPGYLVDRALDIPLSGADLPPGVKRIEVSVSIAGREFRSSVGPEANRRMNFVWDGLDAYGREVNGQQSAEVRIGYVYDAEYQQPAAFASSFAALSGVPILGNRARQEITLEQRANVAVGPDDYRAQGLGGWSVDIHHRYDVAGQVLQLGIGTRRSAQGMGAIITTITGNGNCAFSGDGGPATAASVCRPNGVAADAVGDVFIADRPNNRIRRVGVDGIITTIAGNGAYGFSGDGGPATAASLSHPSGIAVDAAGNVYFADVLNQRIRRVGVDGIITTIAGNGNRGFSGDGGPATAASLDFPSGIAVDAAGNVLIADSGNSRIRRVGVDGIITTIAGNGAYGFSGDGGPATAASLNGPGDVAVDAAGNVVIADDYNVWIRRVGVDGIITTIAGNGAYGFSGDGGPATAARFGNQLQGPNFPIAVDAAGSVFIADRFSDRVRRVSPAWPSLNQSDAVIASDDGSQVFVFDSGGRHLRTLHALTGAKLFEFSYDTAGRLVTIVDGSGNATHIERDGAGKPLAIVAPDGQRTTLELNDANGMLARVTNPAGESTRMTWTNNGLLTEFRNARSNASTFGYDAGGRLLTNANAAGGSWTLSRAQDGSDFTASMTSAGGRAPSYRVEELSTGEQRRTNTRPDGTVEQTLIQKSSGVEQTTAPDGTITRVKQGPDPRFGMLAPITEEAKITTPGGNISVTTTARSSVFNPADPLNPTSVTDVVTVNGKAFTSFYEGSLRQFTATSAAGRQQVSRIDALGRLTSSETTGIEATNYTYDPRGRLSTLAQGSGAGQRLTTMAYNPQGYLASITDPLGSVASFEYDLAGRVTRQTFPDGRQVQFAYDANGNVTSFTPPGRPAHAFAYTPVDLEQTYTPPTVGGAGAVATSYSYNLDKQLTGITRPDGLAVALTYDAGGRLATQVTPSGTSTYSYAATTGKLAGITAPGGMGLGYTYDGFLPLTEAWTGPVAGTVARTYDNDFKPTQIALNGVPVSLGYDNDNLLTQAGSLTIARRADNGLISGTTLGQVTTSQTYNGFGELANVSASYATSALYSVIHTRDKLGRITQKVETVESVASTYDYTYDLAGRLTKVDRDSLTIGAYQYDANGNRLQANGRSATYDDQDRLLTFDGATFAYTANGELVSMTAGGSTTTYDYDVLGNLRGATLPDGAAIAYVIDGRNRRVGKKVNGSLVQGFVYQDQLKPIAELDGAGNVVARFVYGTRPNVPEYMIKGGVNYRFVLDHLGSPRLVVNAATGAVAHRMDFDEWGVVTHDSNPGFQPFGFAGGLHDRHTKLVRFGARDYDARVGRWRAKDPIRFEAGSTNQFAYAEVDPVNLSDSNGLSAVQQALHYARVAVAIIAGLVPSPIQKGNLLEAFRKMEQQRTKIELLLNEGKKQCRKGAAAGKRIGLQMVLLPELQAYAQGELSLIDLMLMAQGVEGADPGM